MAKAKKKTIELSKQKLSFIREKIEYKIVRFYQANMSLDVMVTDADGTKQGMQNIPFAHLPKDMKKIIKPN